MAQQTVMISVGEDGTATYLCNQYTESLFPDAARPRRASHVVPMALPLRILFLALRAVVKDESRAAAWTRGWRCLWQVDLAPVGGPVFKWFRDREVAIDFEVEWLYKNWLGR